MKRIKVAVLAGGWSGERDISLKSGAAVLKALDREKYDPVPIDPRDELDALIKAADDFHIAFVLLHGKFGEDGRIQGLLDILGLPFVGSGVISCAMALNKAVTKGCYRGAGLPVAEDIVLEHGDDFAPDKLLNILGDRVVVKPVSEGSSLGISLCRGTKELSEGIEKAFEYDRHIMVEKYIRGREITCCVLGLTSLETLPLIEIIPQPPYAFFDYQAKYLPGATNEICPAPVPNDIAEEVRGLGKKAHKALHCRLWSRTDMIFHESGFCLLETNTIPGMTENSLFPLAAREAGMSLPILLDRMITMSLDDFQG